MRAYRVNASGMYLQFDEKMEKILIHRVYDASPAKVAGIKENAELRKVNGKGHFRILPFLN